MPEDFARLLSQKISYLLVYPDQAKKNNWEGIVKIKFLVNKDGSVRDVSLTHSSGYPLLDRAALWAVKNASPYPFPFHDRESVSLEIPFEFSLKNGPSTIPETALKPASFSGPECVPEKSLTKEEYTGLIAQNVSLILPYPEQAKEKKWEGITKVKVDILEDGSISTARIARSSGHQILDDAALWAVNHSAPLPSPCYIGAENTSVFVDLAFSLSEKGLFSAKAPHKPDKREKPSTGRQLLSAIGDKKTSPLENLNLDAVFSELLPGELKGFIRTAIENNQPLQAIKEEVNLAKLKVKEAHRSLYPTIKVSAYYTEGDVYKVDYEEEEARLQMEHPLYYSGRLRNAFRQAKVNLAITRRNYDQKMLDTINKTEVAYYTLITLRMNLREQEKILTEAEKILDITKKQFEKNVIIPLELNNVQSWYERLRLLRDGIEQEQELGYLTFTQVLNSQASPTVNLFGLDIREFEIKLPRCIYAALDARPEINLAKLQVKFQEYNKKMAEAQNRLSVDLTSHYGYYYGHYVTEPWKSAKNWYIGLKATKPFGANTFTSSLSKEDQQPKYGQTSPTGSQSISAELGILDNYKQMSEEKKAEVELLKAESELDETQKNITFEVQDAFFKFTKSLLEVKSALTQKAFRTESLKITRAKVYRGEGSFTSLMEALVDLSEAENTYLRALGSYYIAVSGLRKATGYGLEL